MTVTNPFRFPNDLDKVKPWLDSIDVHEDLALTEVTSKPFVETAGVRRTIVLAVANEDSSHDVEIVRRRGRLVHRPAG